MLTTKPREILSSFTDFSFLLLVSLAVYLRKHLKKTQKSENCWRWQWKMLLFCWRMVSLFLRIERPDSTELSSLHFLNETQDLKQELFSNGNKLWKFIFIYCSKSYSWGAQYLNKEDFFRFRFPCTGRGPWGSLHNFSYCILSEA